MANARSTLLVYNTVDRLLRGDLFHTVTAQDVLNDLQRFDPEWPIVGIGTTNWLRRNGEVIAHGQAGGPRFLWADPDSQPVGQVIDVCTAQPDPNGSVLITPRVDSNDEQANFPFLAVGVCDPSTAMNWELNDVDNIHQFLIDHLKAENIGVAGVQIRGQFGQVKATDAFNVPITGLDLTKGYVGDDHFRFASYDAGEWVLNGIFAANPSLQPFISVVGVPLHLHGFRPDEEDGGHIVSAVAKTATATVWPLDDFMMQIHNVGRAMQPVKTS
jgi:hypothetical protein